MSRPDGADRATSGPRPSPLSTGRVPEGPVDSIDLPVPARCLAVVAHPDDAEFLCGATLAKWAARGCVVDHLVLTDGSRGTWDPDADIGALVDRRAAEQVEAARRLGSRGRVVMLDHLDGELRPTLALRDEVAHWIRVLRPEVVLAHDPWKRYRLHPDHRNAGWSALDAVVAARDPHFLHHLGPPHHRPGAVLLFEAEEPDHLEDVEGYVDVKVDALLAHRSQFVTTHDIPPDDDGSAVDAFRRELNDRAASEGAAVGLTAAEAYRRMADV